MENFEATIDKFIWIFDLYTFLKQRIACVHITTNVMAIALLTFHYYIMSFKSDCVYL